MTDKIILKNMMFYAFHGVHEYEREQGQRFYVDLEIETDMIAAGESDDLSHTVDYTAVYSQVKEIVENHRYQLLEALSTSVADSVLAMNGVSGVRVGIRKPAVPIPGPIDYVQIDITRRR